MTPSESLDSHSKRDVFGVAIVAALIALALAFGAQRGRRAVPVAARAGEVTELGGAVARYSFFPTSGRLAIASADARSRADLEMSLVVDGAERPLVMRRGDVQLRDKTTLSASFPIEIGEERATGALDLRMDPASDLLAASLVVTPETGSAAHTYALRIGLAQAGRSLFVPGAGSVADTTTVEARTVVVEDEVHPFALFSAQGAISISEIAPDVAQPGAQPRIVVSTKTETAAQRSPGAAPKPARLDLGVLIGASSPLLWGRLWRLQKAQVAKVEGVVKGTTERAHVIALDEEGHPLIRAATDAQGHFALEAPTSAVQWFAALEAAHTSAPVRFVPGTPAELRLDVSPGGGLHVKVIDADTGQRIVARLLVKGVEGTLDPSFGPDYRASGAGPLMDVHDGDAETPLPSGKYRVAATKGIEWSIDAEVVEVQSGHTKNVELALRHVVPTPGLVGCDLHVHARPSFDSPVTPEDRVLSLVSAGIDFAVPTEHNVVGDYTAPLEMLRLSKQLSHVTGVEVTTYNPRFGHFGVFPYPPGSVPPFKGTTAGAVFAAGRRGDPNRVIQVNHPRLPSGIGYFHIVNFDPRVPRIPSGMRTDFDALEVYNGYDLANRSRTETVLEDWFALLNLGKHIAATGSSDSHRIQYQWAGYPRTYALVEAKAAGDTGQPIDTAAVVAAIKKGRTFVTSGPMIEIELAGPDGRPARPGDEIPAPRGAPLLGKLRVRAAPWVDVTGVEVLAGVPGGPPASPGAAPAASRREVLFKAAIPSRPTRLGKEEGTLDDAASRTVRFDGDLSLTVPEGARWIVVVVRGDRKLDDALPFMPVQPLAFTSAIWLTR
ncbi:MAG: PHP domain-containing protein [Labilithrix sp.]|nr:PHP domain-containing protein [Labilithrix sp.]